jgi:threonine dehydrogenase-like Zn-dependent dehydrogenase
VLDDAVQAAAKGAHIAYIGLEGQSPVNLDLDINRLHFQKMQLVGSNHNPNGLLYEAAADLVREGAIPTTSLVSHRFRLEDIEEGFEFTMQKRSEIIKTVIDMT